jgi:Dolichyl-phosphate-mannose-protein mannosyltransferase
LNSTVSAPVYKRISRSSMLFIGLPLILSAFTHLWNPIGFPNVYTDEGHYMRRAMQVLDGLGFQESRSTFSQPYDHPYFGQIFLAGLLALVDYPDSLNPKPGNVYSIEMLYLVPRLLVGLLAVLDTFLIYKIAEQKYNRKVALLASVLFAVMPMTWILRRVLLDSILLPFLLSSILFALYPSNASYREQGNTVKWKSYDTRYISQILVSGILLGLAIFTKIPIFVMIPLLGYLIYTNNNKPRIRKLKILALWFIPVILIPLLWPTYAIVNGQLDDWFRGVSLQSTGRSVESRSLFVAFSTFFRMDPVLFVIGIAGFIYSIFRRDWYILLWLMPYLLFLYIIGWVLPFHWIPVLPVFCIAGAAVLLGGGKDIVRQEIRLDQFMGTHQSMFINKIRKMSSRSLQRIDNSKVRKKLSIVAALAIATAGFISTIILITENISSSYFELYESIVGNLISAGDSSFNQATIIGFDWTQSFLWIPKYVFDKNVDFLKLTNSTAIPSEKVILIVDPEFKREHKRHETANFTSDLNEQVLRLYQNSHKLAEFKEKTLDYQRDVYPYTNLAEKSGNSGIGRVELRSN